MRKEEIKEKLGEYLSHHMIKSANSIEISRIIFLSATGLPDTQEVWDHVSEIEFPGIEMTLQEKKIIFERLW